MAAAESIGALISEVRVARGMSQLRLAELLCAASGLSTITRHEVSRWEREERVPGPGWLRWLAAVLDVPVPELEEAAAAARARRPSAARGARHGTAPSVMDCLLWTSRADTAIESILDSPAASDLARLAHSWLVDADRPRELNPTGKQPAARRDSSAGAVEALRARLAELRRMDDLVGGGDLVAVVDAELRAAIALLRAARPARQHRRMVAAVAELAQLAGWVNADAGRHAAAVRAYRAGLTAAATAGDRAVGAHILGCLSHLVAASGRPEEALLLARTGYAGARRHSAAAVQVLLLHRIGFAAAVAGDRRAGEQALATAERLADRRDAGRDPRWLYWLDDAELAAMTGRCFTALRRPLRAEPLLGPRLSLPAGPLPARTAAIDGGWLAEAYLDAGEAEQACAVAGEALLAAVRSGSPRAAARALSTRPRLIRAGAAARDYADLLAAITPYLPQMRETGRREAGGRPGPGAPQRLACPP